jgi:hypothetical protein
MNGSRVAQMIALVPLTLGGPRMSIDSKGNAAGDPAKFGAAMAGLEHQLTRPA